MLPHVASLTSILLAFTIIPAIVYTQTTATTAITVSTTKDKPSDICKLCNCSKSKIECKVTKITDLVNVKIPADINTLDLSNNQLTRIHESSFVLAEDVIEVNLAYNLLNYIAANSFRAFKNLTTLCLSHNNLATLEDDSLSELDKLTKLDISHNDFRGFNPEYFAKLTNLKYLIMSENSLDRLHGSIFRNNKKLQQLFLNHGGITRLSDDLFVYTKDLRVLHLENNFIEELPTRLLSHLPMLEVLFLSNNPIHVISALAFPKLPNLQQLILNDMYNLEKIEIYAFADLPMLRNLKIQRCSNLIYIDPHAFDLDLHSNKSRRPQLKNFALHKTGVTMLSKNMLDWESVDDLDLSENPFHCNCNLSWLVDVVKKHDVNRGIKCSTPKAVANISIGRLDPALMLCDNYDPLQSFDDSTPGLVVPIERRFSLLHLPVILILTASVVLSVLLALSLRRRGFFYRKLGGKPTPNSYAGGENVLYMRTTIDY